MINYLLTNPMLFLVWALALLTAITVHEFAHAFTADKLGDPTPRLQGRLTLNPLAHLDPLGTLMLLLFRIGWGRPVEFDPFNLENPRKDAAIISLAGPTSNIILATILSILVRIASMPFSPISFLAVLLPPFIVLNVVLAVFNLIPIHPLDGGKILAGILPPEDARAFDAFMGKYGLFILLLMIFPILGGISPVSAFITPIINFLLKIYLPAALLV